MKIIGFILLQLYSYSNLFYEKLSAFQNDPEFTQATVSAYIKNIDTQEVLIDFNGSKSIIPASTQKLITTSTAFEILGPNYQFETSLSYSGNIQNGVLNGNLYIKGTGDPSFGSDRYGRSYPVVFSEWAQKLKELGINSVNGRVLLNQYEFQLYDIPYTWQWGDIGNYYGATPIDLNINENKIDINLQSGSEFGGQTYIVDYYPRNSSWNFVNKVTSAEKGSGDNVYISAAPFSNTLLMRGTIPINSSSFKVKASIPLIIDFFTKEFETALINNQISISNSNSNDLYANQILVTKEMSKPLFELAIDCNYESINLFADAFAKAIARKGFAIPTFKNSTSIIKNHWQSRGIWLESMNLEDGSGLSSYNKFSCQNLVEILSKMRESSSFISFYNTLPRLGYEGTVKGLDRRKLSNGKVRAKSGSMTGVRAYAGYFENSTGQLCSFMFVINNYGPDSGSEARKRLADLMIDLPNF